MGLWVVGMGNSPNPASHPYWGKALQYQKAQSKSQGRQEASHQNKQQESKPRDFGGFDSLIVGRECVIKLGNGEVVKGLVSAASKYFYLMTVDGQVIVVNKAYVATITPVQTPQNNTNSTDTGDPNAGK